MGCTIVIVDDVETEARELERLLRRTPDGVEAQISTFFSADALEAHLRDSPAPDVLFLDVVLDGENGIDIVGRLGVDVCTQIVYVSGYDQFHTRAYATRHASFLKKPLDQGDVSLALAQALRRASALAAPPLMLRHDRVTDIVRPEDILYVESDRRNVIVHARTASHRAYAKLSDILGQLPPNFVRCHQSYAVNLDCVIRLGTDSVTLASGETVPVSRRWRSSVREALFDRIREGC